MKGVYCIENIINGKKYVGSSKNVNKRKNRHFSELRNDKHKNDKLQNSYNIHGQEAFNFYLLEEVIDEQLLVSVEQRFITELKPWYNINLIANSSLGVKRSEQTKEKIRKANVGLKHPEWRNEVKSKAQGGSNHWTKNKDFSEDSKAKMSKTHKELFLNGYQHPRKGVKEDKETIELKRKRASKPIVKLSNEGEIIEEFSSIKAAHDECGYHAKSIGLCCNNKKNNYLGYVWKFKE